MTTARLQHAATPANRSYCLHLLRSQDHENYLANLLHPSKTARFLHVATRALNVELANIRSSVSNEDLGRLRLAFFRDALSALLSPTSNPSSANLPASPVLDVLAEAVSAFPPVSFAPLHTLLDARERDLAYPSIASLAQLEAFAADTQGSLIAVHASALSDSDSASASTADSLQQAAAAAGKAVGLAVLLRAAPAHAAARLSYMPRDLAGQMNVRQGDLLSGEGEATHLFELVAECAERHVNEARGIVGGVSREVRPAFWPLYMADIYLERLRKAEFNPFEERLQRSMKTTYSLALQMRLLKARVLGR